MHLDVDRSYKLGCSGIDPYHIEVAMSLPQSKHGLVCVLLTAVNFRGLDIIEGGVDRVDLHSRHTRTFYMSWSIHISAPPRRCLE
jgi:hypothetical protein